MLRDSFYAYASAANAAVTEAEFKKVYAYHYTDYTVAFDGLRQAIARGASAQTASSKWAESYMDKVMVEARKVTSCGFTLDQNHTRLMQKLPQVYVMTSLVKSFWIVQLPLLLKSLAKSIHAKRLNKWLKLWLSLPIYKNKSVS